MALESLNQARAKSLNFDFAQNILLSNVLEFYFDAFVTEIKACHEIQLHVL